jgi:hypothetical protein
VAAGAAAHLAAGAAANVPAGAAANVTSWSSLAMQIMQNNKSTVFERHRKAPTSNTRYRSVSVPIFHTPHLSDIGAAPRRSFRDHSSTFSRR